MIILIANRYKNQNKNKINIQKIVEHNIISNNSIKISKEEISINTTLEMIFLDKIHSTEFTTRVVFLIVQYQIIVATSIII